MSFIDLNIQHRQSVADETAMNEKAKKYYQQKKQKYVIQCFKVQQEHENYTNEIENEK